jgi:hypothetical protein
MQLQVHLHQSFLQVLDMSGSILQQTIAMLQMSSQSRPSLSRMETAP